MSKGIAMGRIDWRLHALSGAALLFLALLPRFWGSGYALRLLTLVFMWIALSGCWNLMSGYTGYIDFGPVAYFGIGCYTTAILMTRCGIPFCASIPMSALAAASIALPIGAATLRLRGAYFAIATFAFAEAMKQILLEMDRLLGIDSFGGSHGITLPLGPTNLFFYYSMFAAALATMGVTLWVEYSKFGYALRAIRQAEDTAEITGINTRAIKIRAYGTSAFLLGGIGGIYAYWITYITPQDVFSVHITVHMVIMTLLGGMGTLFGPVVGAFFLTIVEETLWARFIYAYMVLIGAIILAIVMFMPQGIMGTLKSLSRHARS
ncbi:MAG: branched-chain amino acid ABC transporter permease [Deltaproteobacteria bacterium]|nr:branched-chain amino acid ABC transporter permease [Deltaproteobacteria bacterium]